MHTVQSQKKLTLLISLSISDSVIRFPKMDISLLTKSPVWLCQQTALVFWLSVPKLSLSPLQPLRCKTAKMLDSKDGHWNIDILKRKQEIFYFNSVLIVRKQTMYRFIMSGVEIQISGALLCFESDVTSWCL